MPVQRTYPPLAMPTITTTREHAEVHSTLLTPSCSRHFCHKDIAERSAGRAACAVNRALKQKLWEHPTHRA
jgi:hypothetical protein